jgi:hypothetical protein
LLQDGVRKATIAFARRHINPLLPIRQYPSFHQQAINQTTEEEVKMEDQESKTPSTSTTDRYQPADEEVAVTNISTSPTLDEEQPQANSADAHVPPEGGLVAWLAVLAFFLTIMNTW